MKKQIKKKLNNIIGTFTKPRLSIFCSNKYLYTQLIDDTTQHTLISSSSLSILKHNNLINKKNIIELIGSDLAQKAINFGIKKIIINNYYKYSGRVSILINTLKIKGLIF